MLRRDSIQSAMLGGAARPRSDRQWLPLRPSLTSPHMASWLGERGSLTRRLRLGSGSVRLALLRQTMAPALRDELPLLGLRAGQRAWVREVLLFADGQPAVYAHSVMRPASLRSSWRMLARVGLKPVGDAIFERHGTQRGAIRVRRLRTGGLLHRAAQAAVGAEVLLPPLWARRSPFIHRGEALWITEVFLPAISRVP